VRTSGGQDVALNNRITDGDRVRKLASGTEIGDLLRQL
jgi:hypothetical protein